jgi:hypothetical protein
LFFFTFSLSIFFTFFLPFFWSTVMNTYMLIFRGGDAGAATISPEQLQAHLAHWGAWMGSLGASGVLAAGEALQLGGKVIRGTAKSVTDGAFAEGKELVGGYVLIKAANYDAAVEHAKGCPVLSFDEGTVEVREIMVNPLESEG